MNYFNFSEILDSIDETAHDHKTILFKKLQQNPKGVTISGIVDIILQYGISNYGSGPFSLLSLNLLLPFTQEKQPVKKISTKYYTPVKSRRRFSQKP